jgi:hypothetical protein
MGTHGTRRRNGAYETALSSFFIFLFLSEGLSFFNNDFFAFHVDVYFVTYLCIYRFNDIVGQGKRSVFSYIAYFSFEF